ncbi:MAG: hypothetical protein QOI35_1343, partial [Cryptosporangiaceae bacterium]|nr:hypothetical protein [Cryptosporangiaceae bacterium]
MLGDVVRAQRRRLGLSQEDLATHAGISVRGIRKIESHQTAAPRPATVRLLADAFGLTGADRERFYQLALGPLRAAAGGAPRGLDDVQVRPGLPSRHPPAVPGLRLGGPLVAGRGQHLAQLRSAVDAATRGSGGAVFLVGDAGIGKSRLAAETATVAAAAGMHVMRGRAVSAETQFRALSEALLSGLRRSGLPDDP